ncbi:MAG TPA: hypothetical protein VFT59_00265, partial [Candidatus Saccharimonadales bacterium]|nr:hypothetical protein [Candidatus Saccharimonadales bacterium]
EEVTGNYQYVPGDYPYSLVIDGAHTNRSVELVVQSADELKKRRLIIALEGEMLTEDTVKLVKKIADRLILVSQSDMHLPGADIVSSTEEAWLVAQRAAKKDDTLLLVGPSFLQDRSTLKVLNS